MMSDFDKKMQRSLSVDDDDFLKNLEDGRGLFTQMGATFQGPMRFWSIFAWVVVGVATGLGFFCVWKMFGAPDTRSLILWAAGAWAAWTVQVSLKQWAYHRMATLTILRELKKVELRVSRLENDRLA
ncbi:MAG: DUF6768 family protein [Pseudomonadota bacterium]